MFSIRSAGLSDSLHSCMIISYPIKDCIEPPVMHRKREDRMGSPLFGNSPQLRQIRCNTKGHPHGAINKVSDLAHPVAPVRTPISLVLYHITDPPPPSQTSCQ